MRDLSIVLDDRPGALAAMGDALGRAGVSVEGGGAWVVDGRGRAHFLGEAGVNIEGLYSDHDNQLVLVVDDVIAGRAVSDAWMRASA